MNNLIRVMAVLFLGMLAGYSCSDGGEFMFGEINKEKSEEVRRLINNELSVGVSHEEISNFFERHNIAYSYDEFAERYQAIIRNVSPESKADQAVIIYIYVNKEKEFVRAEVEDSFTGL